MIRSAFCLTGPIRHKIKGLAVAILLAPVVLAPVVLASFAVTSCSEPAVQIDDSAPSPALWRITNADGVHEGWLFGTIHSLPGNVDWRTPALDAALAGSAKLVVEIDELDDSGELARIFADLAHTDGLPPLHRRVEPELQPALIALLKEANRKSGDFTATETWAAALTLAQVGALGSSDNGVDRALLGQFEDVLVLEGALNQLSIFDSLAEQDQRDLLHAVLLDSPESKAQAYTDMVKMWLSGDMEKLADETTQGMLADPELKAALLTDRNTDWTRKIRLWLPENEPLFIAVGAAHLTGDDGLPTLLEAAGYTVTREQ